jgi:hypothetical protein
MLPFPPPGFVHPDDFAADGDNVELIDDVVGEEVKERLSQSPVHVAFSLQYVAPGPQNPYWERQWSGSLQGRPLQGLRVGEGVVGVSAGASVALTDSSIVVVTPGFCMEDPFPGLVSGRGGTDVSGADTDGVDSVSGSGTGAFSAEDTLTGAAEAGVASFTSETELPEVIASEVFSFATLSSESTESASTVVSFASESDLIAVPQAEASMQVDPSSQNQSSPTFRY